MIQGTTRAQHGEISSEAKLVKNAISVHQHLYLRHQKRV